MYDLVVGTRYLRVKKAILYYTFSVGPNKNKKFFITFNSDIGSNSNNLFSSDESAASIVSKSQTYYKLVNFQFNT